MPCKCEDLMLKPRRARSGDELVIAVLESGDRRIPYLTAQLKASE